VRFSSCEPASSDYWRTNSANNEFVTVDSDRSKRKQRSNQVRKRNCHDSVCRNRSDCLTADLIVPDAEEAKLQCSGLSESPCRTAGMFGSSGAIGGSVPILKS
jgi:hypothetical protein